MTHEQAENAFRIYVADSVWGIAHGRALDRRFSDIINPMPPETRTAGEVIDHIRKKLEGVE